MDFTLKPIEYKKRSISPSSLYSLRCPRCLWLDYNHGLSIPQNLSLSSKFSVQQENFYDNVRTEDEDFSLKPGTIKKSKGKRFSKNIVINGEESRWKFFGALDFLIEFDDGDLGIADGKVSTKLDKLSLIEDYSPQLHSYLYMLNNPSDGDGVVVNSLGLILWNHDGVGSDGDLVYFKVKKSYLPVEINNNNFLSIMERFINIIEGEFPESGEGCYNCEFYNKIGFFLK